MIFRKLFSRGYLNDSDASGGGGFDSIQDAVAELDRRDQERESSDDADDTEADYEQPDADLEPDDGSEDDEVATDDEPDAVDEPAAKINFDGKELEIPKGTPKALVDAVQSMASDLKADYTRKTQAVAQESQQVRALHEHTEQTRQQLFQTQQHLQNFYQQSIGQPPDPMLLHTEPQRYLIENEAFNRRVQNFQALQAQGQQLSHQQQAEQAQRHEQMKAQAAQYLLKEIPDLADDGKYREFRQKTFDVGQKYGYSPEEIANVIDPRAVLMLRDLAQFQAQKSAAGNVRQKLSNVPPRVQRPGAASPDQGAGQKARDALGQFKKSGMTLADAKRWAQRTA